MQVVIVFDAVMLYTKSAVAGSTYYISAGAEYINGTEIWVGQVGYVANKANPEEAPDVTLTADSQQIYPGRVTVLDLTIQAPKSYFILNVRFYLFLFTHLQGVLSQYVVHLLTNR